MLTVDQAKRLTAEDVLKHQWICGNAPDTALNTSQLKKYNASRKLKAAAAKIIAQKKNIANLVAAAKLQESANA